MKCPVCGRELYKDEHFCMGCGAKINHCPKCGAPYTVGTRFCMACGTALPQEAPAPPTAPRNVQRENPSQPGPADMPRPAVPAKKNHTPLIILAVLLVLAGGGFGYYQGVVIPRRHAAAVEEAKKASDGENQKKEKAADGQKGGKTTDKEAVRQKIGDLVKRKNDFDSRLSKAADTINGGKPLDAKKPLEDLNRDIDKAREELKNVGGSDASKQVRSELMTLLDYERQRSDGMLRGISGDGNGYKTGGDAYDKYHELDSKFQQHLMDYLAKNS